MDDFGLQTPPPPPPPIPTPTPVMPPVPQEDPQISKPSSQLGQAVKRNGIKFAGGLMMALLIIGGVVYGTSMLQQQQRPIEKQAADPCGYKNSDGNWLCPGCDEACYGRYDGDDCTFGEGKCELQDVTSNNGSTIKACKCVRTYPPSSCETISAAGYSHTYCNKDNGGCKIPIGKCATRYWCADKNVTQCDYNQTAEERADRKTVCATTKEEFLGFTERCGFEQIDLSSNDDSISRRCGNCVPLPKPDPSPTPTPEPTIACVDLTAGSPVDEIELDDEVVFTCKASFSAANPVAFFRYSSDGGTTFSTSQPTGGAAINATTKSANQTITIDEYGDWVVQCRICTNSSATACTQWGLAN